MKNLNLKAACLLLALFSWAAMAAFYPINNGTVNKVTYVTNASSTTTAVATGNQVYVFSGSQEQILRLPAATSLPLDWWYDIINNASNKVTVRDGSGADIATTNSGQIGRYFLNARGSTAGTWKYNNNTSSGDLSNFYLKSAFIGSTAGASDAGKPIKTNSSGVIDPTFLPSGPSGAWSILGNSGTTAGTNFLGNTDAVDLVFKTNNSEVMRIKSGGNVGIGTSAPSSAIEIRSPDITLNDGMTFSAPSSSTIIGFDYSDLVISNPDATNNNYSTIAFATVDSGLNRQDVASIQGIYPTHGVGSTTGDLVFSTGIGGIAVLERLRINSAGNVGIGTSAPLYKLQVAGPMASGVAASSIGGLLLSGNTGGTVSVLPQASAGTYNFNLPTTAGSSGQPLLSAGGGASPMTFGTLGVTGGGTGLATLTAHALYAGNGTSAPAAIGPNASTAFPLVSGGASADPAYALLSVAGGGTGLATLTAHALYVGNGASAPAAVSVGATNTVLHGSTGADPSFSAITGSDLPAPATSNITASNVDWSTLKNIDGMYVKALTGSITLTWSNVATGQTIVLAFTNSASNYTLSWPAAAKWVGGATPTLTTGAHTDVFTCKSYDGTSAYCSVIQNF